MNENEFEIWQEIECSRLGITLDQHNRLLEISSQISAAFGGITDAYGDLLNVLSLVSFDLSEHIAAIEQDDTQVGRFDYE